MNRVLIPLVLIFTLAACDEKATSGPACGDGVVDVGEQCDGVNLGGDTCESLGYNGGTLACDDQCSFVRTGCESTGRCGDGSIQEPYEACDGDDLGGASCISLGYQGGELSCSDTCALDESGCDPAPVCGDGEITGNEQCDGGHLQNQSCISLGYYPGGQLACDPITCQYDLSGCELYGRCGDGLIQLDEECDGTNFNSETCESHGFLQGGHLTCGTDCTVSDDACIRVVQISAGWEHACSITADGGAYCWGGNLLGQLGDGSSTEAHSPTPVAGSLDFASIACGGYHTCALATDQTPYCWGSNTLGQLGDGTTTSHANPTPITANPGLTTLALGNDHSCGLVPGTPAQRYCWGSNANGQLGNGTTVNENAPAAMDSGTYTALAPANQFTCSIMGTTGYCYGINDQGQLGDGTTTDSLSPTTVAGSHTFGLMAAGGHHACALDTVSNHVTCWGAGAYGQLGNNALSESSTPVEVSGIGYVTGLTAGQYHSCAIGLNQAVWCWGRNDHGQLGDGTTTNRSVATAVQLQGGMRFIAIRAGGNFTCGITDEYNLYCWGANDRGQLGDGTSTDSSVPVPVAPF